MVINVLVFLCYRLSYLHTPVISDTGKYCSDDLIVGFHPQSPKLFPTHKQYHRDLLLRSVYLNSRGFNRHRRPTKHFGHFDQRSRLLLPPKLEAESIKLKKDSVKTCIKIQFAGPRQYFCFRFKIFKKNLGHKVHYLSKLIKNILSFVLTLVPRTLEIAF